MRPEVWYVLGHATKPTINLAQAVRDMFMKPKLPRFQPALALGGAISVYSHNSGGDVWSAVLIGFELGGVDSPAALEQRVLTPLRAAALERSINL